MATNPKVSDARRTTSNGCRMARRVPRKDARCRLTSSYIAAIDFGTTNCSVAYIHPGESRDQSPLMLPIDAAYRVPTAILFDPNGVVKSFGSKARKTYRNLSDNQRLEWAYFEQIKMDLQHDQTIHREMKVIARNGKEYYLVEVIAHILKHLKEILINKMKRSDWDLEATDFDWVITVPAIWRARGKQMMREAGYKAGLCSREFFPALEAATGRIPEHVNENHPDKLSLALEPESAAIFCQNMLERQVSSFPPSDAPFRAASYIIVDIGGGTVDISAHYVIRDPQPHIKVIHPPTGNDWGGTKVNQEFEKFLQNLVQDIGFSRFLHTPDESKNAKNKVYLNELLNESFERQKKVFADADEESSDMWMIELPTPFIREYIHDINEGVAREGESAVQLVDQDLRISNILMRQFFKPVVNGIVACIRDVLVEVSQVKKMYLVGGFGGSRYIQRCIRREFMSMDINYVVPVEPAHAVVKGAVLFKKNPGLVESRKADATYGLEITNTFQEGLHDTKYRWLDDDGRPLCENLFYTMVELGDVVGAGDVFVDTFYPTHHNQTRMSIRIYSSQEKDIFYVTGERGANSRKPDRAVVSKLGEVKIDMPDLTGDKSRAVDVTFDFSHTEIQVKAYDRTTKKEVKSVINFLTNM